ncbi:class I SAM-dependent methyltransferase [Haladaptatus salinisoli]|uniref:class I SAM-dependent methyltransferase n=1 Tax=Haladaptatus salinisoli TaxID=2884876 RepID=UPI001D09FD95|nr:class I SAM-dependent methyltransferase [Haladaptatus salinisoli]
MAEREREPAGWQLEQSAPEAYERYLVPPMFAPWAERLIDATDFERDDRVLDVGCGTGIVARRITDRPGGVGTVVGLDINEKMLEVAETAAAKSQLEIEWRRGDVTDLPFSDGAFDVVLCQQALQFVTDPSAAFREMRRVLGPGGRVAASVWRPLEYNSGYVELAEALERHVGDDAETMMRSPFPEWTGEDLGTLVRDAGFSESLRTIEIGSMRYPSVEEFVRREAASSPLSEPLGNIEPDVREALIEEVRNALEDYIDDEGIVFPMESHLLTAQR